MDECSVKGWDYAMIEMFANTTSLSKPYENTIVLKGIIDEDFVNYRVPSMTLMFPRCSFKCEKEFGEKFCQNSELIRAENVGIDVDNLCKRYLKNPISKSIVCQGLEPFDSFIDLYILISTLRKDYNCQDPIVIYSGYTKEEIKSSIKKILKFQNIIIKFGRFIPNQEKHFDEVLGVYLASKNQYAERIS